MSYVNKSSLRTEFDAIKAQFEVLSQEGKVSAEIGVLFRSLLMLFELMVSVFLEKTTKKSNHNSSLPSSQVNKDNTRGLQGSVGRGLEQTEERFARSRTVETVSESVVESCQHCGQDLRDQAVSGHERRTRIDLVFEKVVEHVEAQIKTCPSCQSPNKGAFPSDLSGPVQYGLGVKAYVLELLVAQMVPLKRLQKHLQTLLGQVISEATLLKYLHQLDDVLTAWEQRRIEQLLAAPVIHVDETSLRVDRQNYWVHVYSSGAITVKFLHPKRGSEAIEAIAIIPQYSGVIVHDCWASYLRYPNCGHGLCGAHLLRELTFVIDSNGYAWASNLKRLLQQTCIKVAKHPDHQLSEADYAKLQKHYRNLLTRGAKELPPVPERISGRRGRIAKSDAHNLWQRFKDYEASVLLFAKKAEVPFTNNRAERDLRMGKVKQKVSGCFRQPHFAKVYCRISSYLQSMAYQGINPLVAIQLALSGKLYAREG